jgi:hypothetical protein
MVGQLDHWRRTPSARRGGVGNKEWHHFCVLGKGVDLVLNWSLMEGIQTGEGRLDECGRLTILARGRNGWRGGIERFGAEDVAVKAGSIEAAFGPNRMRFDGRVYRLDVKFEQPEIEARLALEPLVTPALTDPLRLGRGGTMRWLVVPRLRVSGWVIIEGRRYAIEDAPGYHDHDWGQFQWGGGFAWSWAAALPRDLSNPWTITATQVTDEHRLQLFTNSVVVWRGADLARGFRREGITTSNRGCVSALAGARPLRVPAAMWLAAPGEAFDIPKWHEVRAEGQGDVIELELEVLDYSQIAIPSDANDDATAILSEIRTEARAHGRIRGERVSLRGPALLELLHVAR